MSGFLNRGWKQVPMPGTEVKSSHPITVLNPTETFYVLEIKYENEKF